MLHGVRLVADGDTIQITCSNSDLTITATVAATVDEPGTVVAPARLVASFLAAVGAETVTVEAAGDGYAHLGAGDTSVTLHTYSAEDWPQGQEAKGDEVFLDAGDLDLIERVMASATNSPHDLTVDRGTLLEALKRMRVIVDDPHNVAFTFDGDKATLTSRKADVGEITDVVPATTTFDQQISFQAPFLMALLEACTDDEVTIGLDDPMKPVMVTTGRLAQALMPMRG